uniref:Uncharacterized protein n=1 Tax=viral metagenome TaxID=1070528 RepID=A0A6M3KD06_9ZZZZ
MIIEVECKTCGSKMKVERFCKIIDDVCRNVEDGRFGWVKWCDIPAACHRGGEQPLLSRQQQHDLREAKRLEEQRLNTLRKNLGGRGCTHPLEESERIGYWYSYGPHKRFKCKICGHIWETFHDDCPNYQGLGD